MSNVFFKEEQRFDNYFALFCLGVLGTGAIVAAIIQLQATHPNYFIAGLLFITSLTIGTGIWWLTRLRMKVSISDKGIKFKLSPLYPKKQLIPWKKIDSCMIIKTPEAAQWCGGNITFNHEKRVSLTGRNGLAIKTKDGENLFIGIKQVTGLCSSLNNINSTMNQKISQG